MQQTSSLVVVDTPFRTPLGSCEAFAHPQWQRAHAAVVAGLARGESVVLLGSPGSGKTLLLDDLAQTLRQDATSVRVVSRSDTPDLAWTANVLLVDDAGSLDAAKLAALCIMGKPVVLAANPDFADRLAELPLSVTPVTLDPLLPQDIARFIAARLSATGQPRDLLEPEAVLALARHSGGSLRLVNALGAGAMFLSKFEGSSQVYRRHVEEAAAMRTAKGVDIEPAAPARPYVPRAASSRMGAAHAAPAAPASHPVWQRRRIAFAAGVTALGLALCGGWAFWSRTGVQPATMQAEDAGRRGSDNLADGPVAGLPGNDIDAALPQPQADGNSNNLAIHSEAADPPRPAATQPHGAKPVGPPVGDTPVSFKGPITNETLNRLGRVVLVITKQGVPGSITVRFDASAGLLGSGELTGHLSDDGHIIASGQLMMGKNPFTCDLSGAISGQTLVGSAKFFRSSSGYTTQSRFTLAKS